MSVWGKILGGAAGLAIGGPIGALIGVVLGAGMDILSDSDFGLVSLSKGDRDRTKSIAFTIGAIALGAKMAKADGRVTRDEVTAFRQVFRIPPEEEENVGRVFNHARQDSAGYEPYARQLAGLFADRPNVLQELLLCLFHIAKADGKITGAEVAFLSDVARIFAIDDETFETIRAAEMGPDETDPYQVLGVKRTSEPEQIKRRYRELVKAHHPDRLSAEGLEADLIRTGAQRMAVINAAYDRIAKDRGLR
ncbi:TerB family tellurite resistance protein [Fodinicurvata sp. EGI_FJ10296]|jgi:DnaJ like chaperone protein|uniref:TerB family tellurite resistance protein n=1 Tax=Fodinicurvata sp. EGI_FJ10296 TaxID=3231908 RepID=UPI003456B493